MVACAGVPLPARGNNGFDHDGQPSWPRASRLFLDGRHAQQPLPDLSRVRRSSCLSAVPPATLLSSSSSSSSDRHQHGRSATYMEWCRSAYTSWSRGRNRKLQHVAVGQTGTQRLALQTSGSSGVSLARQQGTGFKTSGHAGVGTYPANSRGFQREPPSSKLSSLQFDCID